MSTQPNKTLIGAFVLGALVLLVVATLFLGSGKLFTKDMTFVLFFDSSVKGLNVGAPVQFRGVPIGKVTSINIKNDFANQSINTVVFISIQENDTAKILFQTNRETGKHDYLLQLITHGLRARLASQSLLTGQLNISLDFYSPKIAGTPITHLQEYDDDVFELPTIPSQLDNFMQTMSTLPITSIVTSFSKIAASLEQLLADDAMSQTLINLAGITGELNTLLNPKNTQLGLDIMQKLLASATELLQQLQTTSQSYTKLAQQTESDTHALMTQFSATATKADTLLIHLNNTADMFNSVIDPSGSTVIGFSQTLREISEAARAVRDLAALLKRNPESLLLGKGSH